MAISDKITKLAKDLKDSYKAVLLAGGTIPSAKNWENLPNAIDTITFEGGVDTFWMMGTMHDEGGYWDPQHLKRTIHTKGVYYEYDPSFASMSSEYCNFTPIYNGWETGTQPRGFSITAKTKIELTYTLEVESSSDSQTLTLNAGEEYQATLPISKYTGDCMVCCKVVPI